MPQATTVRPHKRMRLETETHFILWDDSIDGYYAVNGVGTVFVKFDDKGNALWNMCEPGRHGRSIATVNPKTIVGIDSGEFQKFGLNMSLSSFVGAFHVDDRKVYRSVARRLRSVA